MNDGEQKETKRGSDWHLQLFRKSLVKQAKLRQITNLLGPVDGKVCLDVGGDNGVISYHLRRLGGTWHSVDLTEKAVESIRRLVGDRVDRITGPTLPFDNDTFDIIVIIDLLEHLQADYAFIAECHRVLRANGRLIVNVPYIKRYALLPPLRRLLGLTDERHGHVRPGYTGSELFDLLKDGFDVETAHTYSRFFVGLLDTFIQYVVQRSSSGKDAGAKGVVTDEQDFRRMKKLFRIYSILYPILQLAAVADLLLFFTQGYSLIACAKRRRQWLPRRTPVLADGRSIAEAALGGRIGTAAPF
jgi:SAM-dependent methyltransferase